MADLPIVKGRNPPSRPTLRQRCLLGPVRQLGVRLRYFFNFAQSLRLSTLLSLVFALLLLRQILILFQKAPVDDSGDVPHSKVISRSPSFRLPPPYELPPAVVEQFRAAVIHDVMPSPSPVPLENPSERPDASLYGTGDERCVVVGDSNGGRRNAVPIWQVNSRALCYERGGVCLSGKTLERLSIFSKRGSGRCDVLSVETGLSREASVVEMEGSCASFRTRRVFKMFDRGFGKELFLQDVQSFMQAAKSAGETVVWNNNTGENIPSSFSNTKELAIIVPKYDWSWNICHYNRIWQNLVYIIRHLGLFVGDEDAAQISSVAILFRAKYAYDDLWTRGMRKATLPALEKETGKSITISKLRYDSSFTYRCFWRAVLLGAEGRVDSYPFLNDTATWTRESQIRDDHIPRIPHDALWLRQTVYGALGLKPAGRVNSNGDFVSVPVPPLVVAFLTRSKRSKRRFVEESGEWFDDTLKSLAHVYGFEVREVRCSAAMPFENQVASLRDVGLAVGIHGANLVNTLFMPATAALFEVFPYRYVRYYYSAGANSGLRYNFHEVSTGLEYTCSSFLVCMFKYRESHMDLGSADRRIIAIRIERAMRYVRSLHEQYPDGEIPVLRENNYYNFVFKNPSVGV